MINIYPEIGDLIIDIIDKTVYYVKFKGLPDYAQDVTVPTKIRHKFVRYHLFSSRKKSVIMVTLKTIRENILDNKWKIIEKKH